MSTFFSGIKQTDLLFQGQTFKSPFFIQSAHAMGAIFLCDFESAKKLLPKNLQPLRFAKNKAFIGIHGIEYRKTDIGAYNELAISILVTPPKGKILRQLLNFHMYAFIFQLPVTTELSVLGGKDLLHYPKFLADISFRETKHHRICTVRDKQNLEIILELECFKARGQIPKLFNKLRPEITVHTFVEEKKSENAIFRANIESAQHTLFWPPANIRLGRHMISEHLKNLKLGAGFYQINIPDCVALLEKKDEV